MSYETATQSARNMKTSAKVSLLTSKWTFPQTAENADKETATWGRTRGQVPIALRFTANLCFMFLKAHGSEFQPASQEGIPLQGIEYGGQRWGLVSFLCGIRVSHSQRWDIGWVGQGSPVAQSVLLLKCLASRFLLTYSGCNWSPYLVKEKNNRNNLQPHLHSTVTHMSISAIWSHAI